MSVRRSLFESFILLLVRTALGGAFCFAAWVKLQNPQAFADSVKAFKILPDHLTILATFAIPWTEALCGLLLVLGLWARSAALLLGLLLIGFVGGIISVLARGLNVECGCFGKFDLLCKGPLGWCNVGQDALFLAAAFLILLRGPGSASLDRAAEHARPLP